MEKEDEQRECAKAMKMMMEVLVDDWNVFARCVHDEDKLDQVNCAGDYTIAGGNCEQDLNKRTILAEEATLDRGIRNTMFVVGGVAIVGSVLAFILMRPSGGSSDSAAAGPTLESIHPWTNSHTAGMGMTLDF